MKHLSTLLLAATGVASANAQFHKKVIGDVWLEFQYNPTTDLVTISTQMLNNQWFAIGLDSDPDQDPDTLSSDMLIFFAQGRNSYVTETTSNDEYVPLVPEKTKDTQEWDWEALTVETGKVPVFIAGTQDRDNVQRGELNGNESTPGARQGINGNVEFDNDGNFNQIPDNLFPPVTTIDHRNSDLIITWQETSAFDAEIKKYTVQVMNGSQKWVAPPNEQCVWDPDTSTITQEIIDGVAFYSCSVTMADLRSYGLAAGDLAQVRVQASTYEDTVSQWSRNYFGAFVEDAFEFSGFADCIDNWDDPRLCPDRLRSARVGSAHNGDRFVTRWDTEIMDYLNIVRTQPGSLTVLAEQGVNQFVTGSTFTKTGESTDEGAAPWLEVQSLLSSLQRDNNLEALTWEDGLADAAYDHCLDSFAEGFVGTDGSTLAQRVARYGESLGSLSQSITYESSSQDVMTNLFVDDGEPSRPNRQNMINSIYKKVGIANCQTAIGRQKTVIVYAQNFQLDEPDSGSGSGSPPPNIPDGSRQAAQDVVTTIMEPAPFSTTEQFIRFNAEKKQNTIDADDFSFELDEKTKFTFAWQSETGYFEPGSCHNFNGSFEVTLGKNGEIAPIENIQIVETDVSMCNYIPPADQPDPYYWMRIFQNFQDYFRQRPSAADTMAQAQQNFLDDVDDDNVNRPQSQLPPSRN